MELIKGFNIKKKEPKGYQIKIQLNEIEPEIWRRLSVDSSIPLKHLHDAIQKSLGWEDMHLHMFVNQDKKYCLPDEEDPGEISDFQDENKFTLGDLLTKKSQQIQYVYDFGDDWAHTITLEKITDDIPKKITCIDGERACPPEDCGGPMGYAELLKALVDPLHDMHDDLKEWISGEFDPEAVDLTKINKSLGKI
ncbi:MAG: plasmid pRiA4b ORF-3 family protein [Leptospirales bacterium]